MHVSEYVEHDATSLAKLLRDGEVAAAEVYEAALEAITKVDATLHAVAAGPWDRPLEHAVDGPFAGVPFVLKDLGAHPQGIPVRSGTRLSGDGVVHPNESFAIQRFRAAGLAIAAMTTAPEFGFNANCEALAYGITRNPWDPTRSAGGSSGGTGALVAAGAVPVGHANDGGGSIRIPAAFNGLVGLKPSRGRISDGPDRQDLAMGLATEGVHSRTLRDTAALLDAIAGAMPGDKFIVRDPVRPWSQEVGADPVRLRVAIHTASWSSAAVDPEVAEAVEAVGRQLEQLGHHVEPATPRLDWEAFIAAELTIFSALMVETIADIASATGRQPGPDTLEHASIACYEHGLQVSTLDMAAAMQTVNAVTRTIGAFFTNWDLLLTPTVNVPPLPLGYLDQNDASLGAEGWVRRLFDVCSFRPMLNWSGTPALSLPLGWTSEGLPIGIQLAAPMCDEATLIRVGSQLEEAMPWRAHRPAVHAGGSEIAAADRS